MSSAPTDVEAATIPSHAAAVTAFLTSQPASDYRSPGALVQLPSSVSINDALKTFDDASVTGAPVYEEEMSGGGTAGLYAHSVPIVTRKYLGFVDVSDLARLVVTKGLERPTPEGFLAKVGALFSTDTEHLVERAINLSGHDPFCGLSLTGNLAQAAKVFARGVHRVAVVDTAADSRVVGIITSSTVLRLIHDNIGILGSLADVAVGRLFNTGPDAVTTIAADASARHAFKVLGNRHFLGAPVVNGDGAIVGNISASDIRSIAGMNAGEAEKALDESVYSYLSFVGRRGGDSGAIRAPITVLPTDTLASVIRLLVTSGVHRVYIVDGGRKPIGIVSVTDVLKVLLSPTVIDQGATGSSGSGSSSSSSDAAADSSTGAGAGAGHGTPDIRMNPSLGSFLHAMSAEVFLGRSGVKFESIVDIASDRPASEVLELLDRHHVSGVAVYVEEAIPMTGVYGYGGPGFAGAFVPVTEKKYVGWVDAGDVTALLLDRGLKDRSKGFLAAMFSKDTAHSASAAINFSGRDPFWAVQTSRPMDQVLRVLSHNVHRLVVIDVSDHRRFIGVITQSAMLQFLAEHKDMLGDLSSVSMSHFVDTDRHPVITCSSGGTLRDVLSVLIGNKVSGVGIVDGEGGKLLGNLSLTDVRRLHKCSSDAELESQLSMNVMEFLERAGGDGVLSSIKPLTLNLEDSFAVAVELLVASKAHRLYIVDGGKPVGVLTLSTVLRAIAHTLPHGHTVAPAAEAK